MPLVLDEVIEHVVLKRLRREKRLGLDGGGAVLRLTDERRLHRLHRPAV
jgi:hypothetical protein